MNCQDIAKLLNEADLMHLSAAERAEAKAHCADCPDCAADWATHQRVATAVVPAMPDSLRHWQPGTAGNQSVRTTGRRRTVIIPLLLLAGAAAAMIALLSAPESEPDAGPIAAIEAEVTATSVTDGETAIAGGDTVVSARLESDNPEPVVEQSRERLVIWPIQYEDDATAQIELAEAAHRAVVRFLRAQENLEVIEATPAQYAAARAAVGDIVNAGRTVTAGVTMLGAGLRRAMALELGADYSVQLASGTLGLPGLTSFGLAYTSPNGNGGGSSSSGNSGDSPAEALSRVEAAATERAQETYARLFPDSGAVLIESVFTDSARSDDDRLAALNTLLRSTTRISPGVIQRNEISAPVLAAAIELGRSSASADTRRRIWEQLGPTGNPLLAQPLTDALLYDADDEVRAVAADALTEFRNEPAVAAALESVAAGAESPELRLRARWSVLDDGARVDHAVALLLDPALTIAERMAPVMLARTRRAACCVPFTEPRDYEIPPLEGAALEALAEIAAGDHDDAVRQAALFELGFAGHPDFVELMFDDTDATLRGEVLLDLSNRRNDPGALERIDQVLAAEPDANVRQMMENLLAPPQLIIPRPAGQ